MFLKRARTASKRSITVAVGVVIARMISTQPVAAQTITAGNTSGARGTQVTIPVTLQNGGLNYFAATENRIAFDPINIPVAPKVDGTPDCTVNSGINKLATFAFWPTGCTAGASCQQVRTAVYFTSASQNGLIADGATLYTCKINILGSAPVGQYPLVVTGTRGATGGGVTITTTAVSGYVNAN
ncbi:MAG: hypothetical protein SF182_01785 [Deltaproteobacteria bacterium]|nr:hypothetical protein [Deltaproteobacteria bacterium]